MFSWVYHHHQHHHRYHHHYDHLLLFAYTYQEIHACLVLRKRWLFSEIVWVIILVILSQIMEHESCSFTLVFLCPVNDIPPGKWKSWNFYSLFDRAAILCFAGPSVSSSKPIKNNPMCFPQVLSLVSGNFSRGRRWDSDTPLIINQPAATSSPNPL